MHHVECTAANVADVTQVHKLLHGQEDTVCGDSGYTGADKREELQRVDAALRIAEKPGPKPEQSTRAAKNSGTHTTTGEQQMPRCSGKALTHPELTGSSLRNR